MPHLTVNINVLVLVLVPDFNSSSTSTSTSTSTNCFCIYISTNYPYISHMEKDDNRRYPRIPHVTSRQIVRIDQAQTPKKNIVLTENLSGAGIKFTTNEEFKPATYFLVYLNDLLMQDLDHNSKNLLKTGDYYLSKVIWSNQISNNIYEIGASFLEKKQCDAEQIETFTELVNITMLDALPEISKRI